MKLAVLLALLPILALAQAPKPTPSLAWGYITGQLTYPAADLPAQQRVLRVTAIPVAGDGRSYSIGGIRSTSYRLRLPAGEYYVYATSPGAPNRTAYYTSYEAGRRRYYGCPSGDARARMRANVPGAVLGGWRNSPRGPAKLVVVEAGHTTANVNPQGWGSLATTVVSDTLWR